MIWISFRFGSEKFTPKQEDVPLLNIHMYFLVHLLLPPQDLTNDLHTYHQALKPILDFHALGTSPPE